MNMNKKTKQIRGMFRDMVRILGTEKLLRTGEDEMLIARMKKQITRLQQSRRDLKMEAKKLRQQLIDMSECSANSKDPGVNAYE